MIEAGKTERYEKVIAGLGMEIVERFKTLTGMDLFRAEMATGRGLIAVTCGSNGTARIDKPNGTHKWYYEKSTGELRAAVKQVLDYWR